MSAAELTPVILTRNDISDLSTGNQAVMDCATGCYIDFNDTSQNNQQGSLILIVGIDSDNAGGDNLTILTSTEQPFSGSGQSNFSNALSADSASFIGTLNSRVSFVGPIETARYLDTDGYINIAMDTASSGTHYITAIVIP